MSKGKLLRICLTGGTGFVGSALIPKLVNHGVRVTSLVRPQSQRPRVQAPVSWVMWDGTDLQRVDSALGSAEAVVHLAGLAHVLTKPSTSLTKALYEANVLYTDRLARAAVSAGVRRFVYVSSLAVYGSALSSGNVIEESTALDPVDAYGHTKLEAEQTLRDIATQAGMELVIVRPALVVGEGAPGNLARLANLVKRGIPVPVPTRDNQRSFVTVNNLSDLLISCAQDEAAAGEVFVAAEQEQPSTKTVLKWIGEGMGRRVRTVSVPDHLFRTGLSLVGKAKLYDKVFGDLPVDSTKACQLLGWKQREPLDEVFRQLGSSYAK